MFGPPKCPKCAADLHAIDGKAMLIGDQLSGPIFHGVVATCPHCRTVLGVLGQEDDTKALIAREMDELRKSLGLPTRRR